MLCDLVGSVDLLAAHTATDMQLRYAIEKMPEDLRRRAMERWDLVCWQVKSLSPTVFFLPFLFYGSPFQF